MAHFAEVINAFKIPGARNETPVGERLEIRDYDSTDGVDNGQAYTGNEWLSDIPSDFSNEYLKIISESNNNQPPKGVVPTMPIFARVIKDLKLPEFTEPIRTGETLSIRFEDPDSPHDHGTVYKDNIRVCDVSSDVGEEFLQVVESAETIKHIAIEKTDKLRVIQTQDGFLDDCIDEGFWQEKDEPNYSFTDNPYQAAEFYDDKTVPKYLGVTPHRKLHTAQDCADYVGGKLVTIQVIKTVTWEIIG